MVEPPTPLKNDGLRQLGLWNIPIYDMENPQNIPNHQAEMDDDWDDLGGIPISGNLHMRSGLWGTNP